MMVRQYLAIDLKSYYAYFRYPFIPGIYNEFYR